MRIRHDVFSIDSSKFPNCSALAGLLARAMAQSGALLSCSSKVGNGVNDAYCSTPHILVSFFMGN